MEVRNFSFILKELFDELESESERKKRNSTGELLYKVKRRSKTPWDLLKVGGKVCKIMERFRSFWL